MTASVNQQPVVPKKYVRLGRNTPTELKVVLFAPLQTSLGDVELQVYREGNVVFNEKQKPLTDDVGNYVWVVAGLEDGVSYTYNFFQQQVAIDLGGGLLVADLKFTFMKFGSLKHPFLFSSCHGIKDAGRLQPWGMMEKLYKRISSPKKQVSDWLRAGDQYYCDTVAEKHFPLLLQGVTEEKINSLRRDLITNAFEHMDNLEIRKSHAQVPSLWIADDHDFNDGWGSTPGHFNEGKYLPHVQAYGEQVIRLYKDVQQIGNPDPILTKDNSAFSWALETDEMAVFALDLRTERIAETPQLMAEDSKAKLFERLRGCRSKVVFVIVPILPFKNDPALEDTVLTFARTARLVEQEMSKDGFQNDFERVSAEALLKFSSVEDDASDSLTSRDNKEFLRVLLEELTLLDSRGQKVIFLSGDVHNASSVEATVNCKGRKWKTYLFISSPLSYKPMHRMIEALYRRVGETHIELPPDVSLSFYSHGQQADRNFGEIRPDAILGDVNKAFILHQESSLVPRMMLSNSEVSDFELGESLPIQMEPAFRDISLA